MAVEPGQIRWYSPDPRGIIPLDTFHAPKRLGRIMRQGRFDMRVDSDFGGVIRACAARHDDEGSWIDDEILESYCALHAAGVAHSVETWQDGALVGGLYGVAIGGAFFGESMFHHVRDASKVALLGLVEHLRSRKFVLLDTQWLTPHLQQFGAIEVPRTEYLHLLTTAVNLPRTFGD